MEDVTDVDWSKVRANDPLALKACIDVTEGVAYLQELSWFRMIVVVFILSNSLISTCPLPMLMSATAHLFRMAPKDSLCRAIDTYEPPQRNMIFQSWYPLGNGML